MPPELRSRGSKPPAKCSQPDETKFAPKKRKRKQSKTVSPYFTQTAPNSPKTEPPLPNLTFTLHAPKYGLIQERICDSLYALVVQSILWNQTRGSQGKPVLYQILVAYPTPAELSSAPLEDLTAMLQPIGLHNRRAARLKALAETWLSAPPCKERRYRRPHYPDKGCGADIKPGEVLGPEDQREGWEIAHLPGMGAYALDSYRIFYRDRLRGVEGLKGIEPEWKRVKPTDKELIPYLAWKRTQEIEEDQENEKNLEKKEVG
jgi:methyl-CpG-binding domain protein 4